MKTADDVLAHFGVKGQKWGVRRRKGSGLKGVRTVDKLTDQELKDVINRIQLEQSYKKAVKSSSTKAGAEFAKKVGNQAASVAVGAATSFAVQAALKKAIKS